MLRAASSCLVLLFALGGATWAQSEEGILPQGPGHVFPTVEAAAIDGLAYAHLQERDAAGVRVSRGGTIYERDSGYSYGRLRRARVSAPEMLRLSLGVGAVAHFHTYPRRGGRIDRRNETHSAKDRRIVDRIDDRHRPSFVLTPSLRVVVYRGKRFVGPSEGFLTRISPRQRQGRLASQSR